MGDVLIAKASKGLISWLIGSILAPRSLFFGEDVTAQQI